MWRIPTSSLEGRRQELKKTQCQRNHEQLGSKESPWGDLQSISKDQNEKGIVSEGTISEGSVSEGTASENTKKSCVCLITNKLVIVHVCFERYEWD